MTEQQLQKEAEIIVTKIFYSPATNGQAEMSIQAGIEDVLKFVSGQNKVSIEEIERLREENDLYKAEVERLQSVINGFVRYGTHPF